MTLTKKMQGDVLRVDVPRHGKFSAMTVLLVADTKNNWNIKVPSFFCGLLNPI